MNDVCCHLLSTALVILMHRTQVKALLLQEYHKYNQMGVGGSKQLKQIGLKIFNNSSFLDKKHSLKIHRNGKPLY